MVISDEMVVMVDEYGVSMSLMTMGGISTSVPG
jgi:hypothetical protein